MTPTPSELELKSWPWWKWVLVFLALCAGAILSSPEGAEILRGR